MIDLRLLGPLEVRVDGEPVTLGGHRARSVLAYLAMQPDQVVSDEVLAEDIWDGSPPRTAATTLRVYVSRLRKVLRSSPDFEDGLLASRPGGYVLQPGHAAIDVRRFEDHLNRADSALVAGAASAALAAADAALAEWRGPALLDFRYDRFARTEIDRLEERRLDAWEIRIQAALALGRYGEVTAELQSLVETYPLREAFCAQLMRALYGAGRQAEALGAAQKLRHTLTEELGLDPGPEIARLETQILNQDPRLLTGSHPQFAAGAAAAVAVERQPVSLLAGSRIRYPLFEREAQMDDAALLWRAVVAGGPQTMLIRGSPGIGKTRLLTEILGTLGPSPTVRAGRAESQDGRTFGLLVDCFPELRDPIRSDVGENRRESVGDHLLHQLDELHRYGPLVWVLDDLHLVDAATAEVLAYVLPRLRTATFVLAAARSEPSAPAAGWLHRLAADPAITTVTLPPLTDRGARQLFGAIAPDSPVARTEAVLEVAGGVPLLIEELSRAWGDETSVPAPGDTARRPWAALATRFDQGGPHGRTVGQIAAVLGRDCEVGLFTEVSAEIGCPGDLADLTATGILETPEESPRQLRFTHALLAEAAVRTLTSADACRLHLAAARAMATRADRAPQRWAGPVAEHYAAALPFAPLAEAVPYIEMAARAASEIGAYEQARHWLEELIRLRSNAPDLEPPDADLWLRLGAATADAGDWEASRKAYLTASTLVGGRPVELGRAVLGYVGPWQSIEELDPTFDRLAEQAVAMLPSSEASLRSQIMGRLATARFHAGEAGADRLAVDALREARRSGETEAIVWALHAAHMTSAVSMDRTERRLLADEMIRLCVRGGLDALAQIGRADRVSSLLEEGRVRDAAACVRSHDRALAKRATALQRWWNTVIHSTLTLIGGDLDGAERAAESALTVGTRLNADDATSIYGVQLFTVRWAQGRVEELRTALGSAVAAHPETIAWRAGLALSSLADGDPTSASRHLSGILTDDLAHDRFRTPVLCILATVAAALPAPALAKSLYELLRPQSGTFAVVGTGFTVFGPVDRFLGLLAMACGDRFAAEHHLLAARVAVLREGATVWIDAIDAELAQASISA